MTGGCHSKITAVALAEAPTRRDRRSLATASPQSHSLPPWSVAGCLWRTVPAHGHEEAVCFGTDSSRMAVGKGDANISRSTGRPPGLMAG